MLGFVAESLPLFRCVNPVEPDFLSSAIVHDVDGVAVRDADNTARVIICTNLSAQHQEVKDSQGSADRKE